MGSYDLLKGQFELVQNYAKDAFEDLTGPDGFLENITDLITGEVPGIDDSWIDYNWPTPTLDPTFVANRPVPPDIDPADLTPPDRPDITDIEIPELPFIPTLDVAAPSIREIIPPDTDMPEEPGEAPQLVDPTIPPAPQYQLPELPNLDEIIVPAAPGFDMPPFDVELPAEDLEPLLASFVYDEAPYQSDVLIALREKLLAELEAGSTGLGEEVEEALWNRARERTKIELEKAYDEVLNFWASRGWSLPPGQIDAQLAEIRKTNLLAQNDINEKITIEQARLIQAHNLEIIKSCLQFEAQLQSYSSAAAGRTLDAAKAAVQLGIEVYQANVTYFNLRLDKAKTAAAIYESRIRAAMLELEAYKSRLEGVRIHSDIQARQVEIYRAQLAAVQTVIDLYKSEMQATALQVDIGKARLDAYRLSVQVYSEKIAARTAEYNLYQAQLAGEESKVRFYSEQIKAYGMKVEATKAAIEALRTGVAIQDDVNKSRLAVYQSDIERYKTDAAVEKDRVDSLVKAFAAEVEEYHYDVRAVEADLNSQVEVYKGRVQQAKNQTDILLEQARANLQAFLQNRTLSVEATKAAANVLAQLAASALSAAHAGINVGYSESENYDRTRAVPTMSTSYLYQFTQST